MIFIYNLIIFLFNNLSHNSFIYIVFLSAFCAVPRDGETKFINHFDREKRNTQSRSLNATLGHTHTHTLPLATS